MPEPASGHCARSPTWPMSTRKHFDGSTKSLTSAVIVKRARLRERFQLKALRPLLVITPDYRDKIRDALSEAIFHAGDDDLIVGADEKQRSQRGVATTRRFHKVGQDSIRKTLRRIVFELNHFLHFL